MGRYPRRRGGSQSYDHSSSRSAGYERALQHIREAEQLSRELGGTDEDVKHYFFSLPPRELASILEEYGRQYGRDALAWAEKTFQRWRSGRTKMSGLVAGRLYDLLPPRMPMSAKYDLVRSLWNHVAPRSEETIYIGPDAEPSEIIAKVRSHLEKTVLSHHIPDGMKTRFRWLADGDVKVEELLLNYLRQMERELVASVTDQKLPVLLRQIRERADVTQNVQEVLILGNHVCRLVFSPLASGVGDVKPANRRHETVRSSPWPLRTPQEAAKPAGSGGFWWLWVLGGILLLGIFVASKQQNRSDLPLVQPRPSASTSPEVSTGASATAHEPTSSTAGSMVAPEPMEPVAAAPPDPLRPEEPAVHLPPAAESWVVVSGATMVNLRSDPNTSRVPLTTLPGGTWLEFLDRSGNWVRVREPLSGLTGWVHGNYVGAPSN